MSLVTRAARPTLAVARSARAVRYAHFENVVDQTIPGGSKKGKMFAFRFITYVGVAVSIPVICFKWGMYKGSGGAA